jgi:hypothetical protein
MGHESPVPIPPPPPPKLEVTRWINLEGQEWICVSTPGDDGSWENFYAWMQRFDGKPNDDTTFEFRGTVYRLGDFECVEECDLGVST